MSGGTATATVKLTSTGARLFNSLAGKHLASAGTVIGTGSVTPTFA